MSAGAPAASAVGGIPAVRMEEAGLNALQTQWQLFYDGWLLRLSAGVARRARSVNPHFGSTQPLAAKIAHCERVYAQHGLPLLFRMTPFVQPAGLDAELAARGFVEFDESLVQAVAMARPPAVPAHEAAVEAPDANAFIDAVCDLRESTPVQREAMRERLLHTPLSTRFAVVRAEGRPVCTAQVALEGPLVGLYDVVTAPAARGRGYATLACTTLLSWAWQHGAQVAYLQVNATNAPALAIYARLGFATVYAYRYRARPESFA
jgi:GNAT superfamily N-acetyltransferase